MAHTNRRAFLTAIAGAAALTGCAGLQPNFFTIEGPTRRPRKVPKGEKINVACIGIGGKGKTDAGMMKTENVVALCDVDAKARGGSTTLKAYPNAVIYKDYRVMLREMDTQIDAVTISAPDHVHFPAAMMAIGMGKHVYVQKPLCRTVWECRMVTEAARKHGVATQMGNQGHGTDELRRTVDYVSGGLIGDVKEIHIWTNRPIWPQGDERPAVEPVPETLDWDLWLNVAPWREYHKDLVPFKWRGFWDFGTGALGDMGCHIFDAPVWATDPPFPTSVEAEHSGHNMETFPKWSIVTYQFGAKDGKPAFKLVWYDGKKKDAEGKYTIPNIPPRPEGLEETRKLSTGGGSIYIGTKGTLLAGSHGQSPRLIPEADMKKAIKEDRIPEQRLPKSPGHYVEWIEACKGGTPGLSNFDYAGPMSEIVMLGNLPIRYNQKIEMDPITMKVKGLGKAMKYTKPKYRKFAENADKQKVSEVEVQPEEPKKKKAKK